MAGFNPKQYLLKLQGKDYLEVRWRVVWFRETHPTGAITTELIATEPTVIVRAQVHGADGVILASDYGTAPAAGKGTWTGRSVEKASTAAIGRALALAGFGTQFDADDEGDNLADSPVDPPQKAEPPADNEPLSPDAVRSLVLEGKRNGMTDAQVLAALGCTAKWSEYTGTMSQAREIVRKAADALKAANGAAMPDDAFGGAK
jgi:hypothetical protein